MIVCAHAHVHVCASWQGASYLHARRKAERSEGRPMHARQQAHACVGDLLPERIRFPKATSILGGEFHFGREEIFWGGRESLYGARA